MSTENNETVVETTEKPEKTFTQSQLDEKINARLETERKKMDKKYSEYLSPEDFALKTEELTKQLDELGNSLKIATDKASEDADSISKRDETIADLENKVKKYETDSAKIRIGLENGIPFELCNKLSGDTEEEMLEDAKKMAAFMAPASPVPLRNPESSSETDGVMAAFKALNPNIKF